MEDHSPEAGPNAHTALIASGPLAGDGTVHCVVQVGGTGRHVDSDTARVSGQSANGVAVVTPTEVRWDADSSQGIYLCLEFRVPSGLWLYWDAVAGRWDTDVNVPCEPISPVETAPIRRAVDEEIYTLNPMVCDRVLRPYRDVIGTDPRSRIYVDSDGDLYVNGRGYWDCPPYEPENDGRDPIDIVADDVVYELDDLPHVVGGTSGSITVTDVGNGPEVAATGEFANGNWVCYESLPSLYPGATCEWVGPSQMRPYCGVGSATAVAMPNSVGSSVAWGRANAWTICEGDFLAEFIQSGVADANTHVQSAQRVLVPQLVRKVFCNAYDNATPRYFVACDVTF